MVLQRSFAMIRLAVTATSAPPPSRWSRRSAPAPLIHRHSAWPCC